MNASWGLGLAVVGGETNPDDYLVSKITGDVVRRTVNSKDVEYVVEPGGRRGTVRVEVPAERRNVACLDDDELAALVDLGKRCERHFGGHQDVEWAIERETGKLHALQTRPVTAAQGHAAGRPARRSRW